MGLLVWLAILVLAFCRAIGAIAKRRLCNRRGGRSPFEDDLRRFGEPTSSKVMSCKTLERLRLGFVAGGEIGACSSVGDGTWNVNLRVGNEPGIGIGSAVSIASGATETPVDFVMSTKGEGSGVSSGWWCIPGVPGTSIETCLDLS